MLEIFLVCHRVASWELEWVVECGGRGERAYT